MTRYRCPACDAAHECPDDLAGTKGPCPSCGQRLQFPFPRPEEVRQTRPATSDEPEKVNVSARLLEWPRVCACCLGETTSSYQAVCSRVKGGRTEQNAWNVPYCGSCIEHVKSPRVPTRPTCTSTGPAVVYDRWAGSVHCFRFVNREYARRY